MTEQDITPELAAVFTAIAQQHLFIETLEERGRDALDFHDCGVCSLQRALLAAYQAGRAASTPRRTQAL